MVYNPNFDPPPPSGLERIQTDEPRGFMTSGQIAALGAGQFVPAGGSIQAAIDALPSTGGVVLVPSTTFVVTAQITCSKDNVIVQGAGWGTVLQRGPALAGTNVIIRFTGANCLIRDLTIDGGPVVNTGADLGLDGVGCKAFNIQAINPGGNIQVRAQADDCRVAYSTITGSGVDANIGQGIWAHNNKKVEIDHNTITNTGIDGIAVDGTGSQVHDNVFSGCHCYTAVGGGQLVVYPNAVNASIANNTFLAGGSIRSMAIELNGTSVALTGNMISDQKRNGIAVVTGTEFLFSGNVVKNSAKSLAGWSALDIPANVGKVTVTGNRFIDNQATATQAYGINIAAGTGDDFLIVGNDFEGNLTGAILDASTGLKKTISDNLGIDSVIGTIASGATLTLPLNPNIALTGSVTATVIAAAGCWTGRQGKFIPTGAAVFTAGATIGNTYTAVANVPFGFTFDGTKLYLG